MMTVPLLAVDEEVRTLLAREPEHDRVAEAMRIYYQAAPQVPLVPQPQPAVVFSNSTVR